MSSAVEHDRSRQGQHAKALRQRWRGWGIHLYYSDACAARLLDTAERWHLHCMALPAVRGGERENAQWRVPCSHQGDGGPREHMSPPPLNWGAPPKSPCTDEPAKRQEEAGPQNKPPPFALLSPPANETHLH